MMKNSLTQRLQRLISLSFACFLAISATIAGAAVGSGTIAGRVYNKASSAYLQGAEITVSGQPAISIVTDRDGSFNITGVEVGEHNVKVFYTGMDVVSQTVNVKSGETVNIDAPMTAGIYKLDAFQVTENREGNAASIIRQKNTDGIKNIVAIDAFGNVPDGNVGQLMKRLPGVHVMTAEGEIIALGLRGAPPALSMVTMDSAKMPAASGGSNQSTSGDRAPAIDRVPAEFIKEIEVNKASTPDMAVEGLGGSVNLVTKSAFDFRKQVTSFRAGVNYNTYRTDQRVFTPNFQATFMDQLLNHRLGVTLVGSYTRNQSFRDRIQEERNFDDGRNTLWRFLDDSYMTTRYGVKGALEWRPDSDTSIGLDLNLTHYFRTYYRNAYRTNDFGGRRIIDYSKNSRAAIIAGAPALDATGNSASVGPDFTPTRTELFNQAFTTQASDEQRWGDAHKVGIFGSRRIGDWRIFGQASTNPNKFKNYSSDNNVVVPLGIFGFVIDGSKDLDRPEIIQTAGPSIYRNGGDFDKTLAAYNTSRFYSFNNENLKNAVLNIERKFDTHFPVVLKSGLAWTEQTRNTYVTNPAYQLVGKDGINGRSAPGVNDDADTIASLMLPSSNAAGGYGLFNNHYGKIQQVDLFKAKALLDRNPQDPMWRYTGASSFDPPKTINEGVNAAYIMAKGAINDIQIVGGVRGEQTKVAAVGRYTDRTKPASVLETVEVARDYKRLFPSLHVRYAVRPNLLLRAAYSTSMARPAIGQLIPDTVFDPSAQIINQNNPGLTPTLSTNYDLSAEYYTKSSGYFTVGVFQKNLKDFIYTDTRILDSGADNGFKGQYAGWTFNTQKNGGQGTIKGLELNYTQSLDFLPKPFNGLSVYGNYTSIKTNGEYGYGIGGPVGGALITALPNFMPKTCNLGLSYAIRGFEYRVQARYQSSFLIGYSSNDLLRQYNTSIWNVDMNLSYKLPRGLKLYCDVTNVTNTWPSFYNGRNGGDKSRIWISEVYGTRFSFGLSGRF